MMFFICVSFQQNETPRDIARRKNFTQILEILENPPPVVSPEERLKKEKEENKKESKKKRDGSKEKGEKKREKTNDSGTSSKDSSTRMKDKKKVSLCNKRCNLLHLDVKNHKLPL